MNCRLLTAAAALSFLPVNPGLCAWRASRTPEPAKAPIARSSTLRLLGSAIAAKSFSTQGAQGALTREHWAAAAYLSARELRAQSDAGSIELRADGLSIALIHRAGTQSTERALGLENWRQTLNPGEIAAVEALARQFGAAETASARADVLDRFFDQHFRSLSEPTVTGTAPTRANTAPKAEETLRPFTGADSKPAAEVPAPTREPPSRLPPLDAARGLAILAMIPRNLGGIFLVGTANPWWFTASGALVPALFLLINGFVIAYSTKKNNPFWYYALRGLRVALVSGIILDAMVWHIAPLAWFDVLTTVSIVIPVIYWVRRLPAGYQLAAALTALAASFPIRGFLGYELQAAETLLKVPYWEPFLWAASFFIGNELLKKYVLKAKEAASKAKRKLAIAATAALFAAPMVRALLLPEVWSTLVNAKIFNHMLSDGWFPVFPWIGFAMLGSYLATRFAGFFTKNDKPAAEGLAERFFTNAFHTGLVALAAGVAAWLTIPPHVVARMGYTIPIFPPSWQYLLAATGGVLMIVGGFYRMRHHPWVQKPYEWLQKMGRRSLEIYVFHEVIGQVLILHTLAMLGLSTTLGWFAFLGVSLATIAACYTAAYLLEKYKFQPWL